MTNATVCATLRLSSDTIQGSCDRVRNLVELLAVGRDVPRVDLDGALEELVGAGRRLREAVAEGSRRLGATEEQPAWTTTSEMRAALERLAARLELAGRLETLALELGAAQIVERVEARRRRLESLRSAARAAIATADPALAGNLVWPPEYGESWTRWVLTLEDPEATRALDSVCAVAPALGDLLTALSAEQWEFAAAPEQRAAETVAPAPAFEATAAYAPPPAPETAFSYQATPAPAPSPWQDAPQPAVSESPVWAPAEDRAGDAFARQPDGPAGAALPLDAMLGSAGQDHGGTGSATDNASFNEPAAESWVAQWRRNRLTW